MNKTVSVFLDLLRFAAAIVVVLAHFTEKYSTRWPNLELWGLPAVAIFFVLSGFVISFVSERKETDARSYAIARLARLYSVMVPAVLLSGLVLLIGTLLNPGFMSQFSTMHNLLPLRHYPVLRFIAQSALMLTFTNALHGHEASPAMNVATWSLGYEGPYYAFFAVCIFARGWKRSLLLTGLTLLCGLEIVRLFPVWLAGVALQRVLRVMPNRLRYLQGSTCVVLMYLALSRYGSFLTWSRASHGHFINWLLHGNLRANDEPQFYYWGALAVLLIYSVAAFEPLLKSTMVGSAPAIRWFAGHTFSIYLYHLPLLALVAALVPYDYANPWQKILILFAVLTACVCLSILTERQKTRWREKITWVFDQLDSGIPNRAATKNM
jgi:peptidoglycan/LPS O-acetylase OafA/YrhL